MNAPNGRGAVHPVCTPLFPSFGIQPLPSELPVIEIAFSAYHDMVCMIANAGRNEIGWLGSLEKASDRLYRIREVFLFRQTVNPVECELDTSDVARFIFEKERSDPLLFTFGSSLRFWGHLHPGSSCDPSMQDERQMKEYTHCPFFLRGIMSRTGKARFDLFDFELGRRWDCCPWRLEVDEERFKMIADGVKEKAKSSG